VLSLRWIIFW